MNLSVFDLFKVGIGPSSSHTVGPMVAAFRFVSALRESAILPTVGRVVTDLYGSLALTGRGHATDKAVLLGLSGEKPDTVDADAADALVDVIRGTEKLRLGGEVIVPFREADDLLFHETETLPFHPNGVRFTAYAASGEELFQETYYSVGGGFVVREGEETAGGRPGPVPHPFTSAAELLAIGRRTGLAIADIIAENEATWRPPHETDAGLDHIWGVMDQCMARGMATGGTLPGGLGVKRRAHNLHRQLTATATVDPLAVFDWVSLFALAVNEENAAGGRVVTAPTNGAAGVIPAVLAYYYRFYPGATAENGRRFLLTAAAVGMLYKRNASLSAAEVGCQGEVGVACSMAAAGLAAVMGGTNAQIENAAEIGMEHNLGLTCDPVGGLVQVPCIERNTMGAVKAVNAARLAVLHGDGTHRISLDHVIETMRRTGADMQVQYKETSLGGLAVNRVEC
ncbi:L-serine ammonia-lyase [Limnoglobus roseus]|uniref:L-serine dehydratase n=1 Tax=Limnoglobus roseus TaxID=2598579 RepID=A0A5C1ADZ6_9BACT|nr:L-serine ammonia-lyase [Limnoglobus roseus]QEL16473.1 L-serine ammonia-lyase [Limnoglobus roseus]